MITTLTDFWAEYNGNPDSVWPLYLPLTIWTSAWVYTAIWRDGDFLGFFPIHHLHNYGIILLGQISMQYASDDVLRERIVMLWTTTYFAVDLVACVQKRDVPYGIHAACCLVMGTGACLSPLCHSLRICSKVAMLEISTPFLYLSKQTRKSQDLAIFCFVFTCCRVLWIPHIMSTLNFHGMPIWHPVLATFFLFYGLNLFWYYRIWRLLLRTMDGDESNKKITEKEA